MTVQQLIDQLKKLDPNERIVNYITENGEMTCEMDGGPIDFEVTSAFQICLFSTATDE